MFKGKSNEVYNVGSDQAVSIAETAETVRDSLAPSLDIKILQKKNNDVLPSRYVPDISKASALGLSNSISFKDAILKTAEHEKSEGDLT